MLSKGFPYLSADDKYEPSSHWVRLIVWHNTVILICLTLAQHFWLHAMLYKKGKGGQASYLRRCVCVMIYFPFFFLDITNWAFGAMFNASAQT